MVLAAFWSALEWDRPGAVWALTAPFLLLLATRLRARPEARATGTLPLWKEVLGARPQAAASRRLKIPLPVWLLAAALFLGGLGLAGPRQRTPGTPRLWTLVLDHSPATGLAFEPGGTTRLARALGLARAWLESNAVAEDRVTWRSSARPPLELGPQEAPPASWLQHPPWFAPAPRWELHDAPGVLWVTGAEPSVEPVHAGVFASGGAAVPGPVARVLDADAGADPAEALLIWDGERIERRTTELEPRRLALVAGDGSASVPAVLARLARSWAAARRFEVVTGELAAEATLVLECLPLEGPLDLGAGRDGWSVTGRASARGPGALPDGVPQERWLVAPGDDGEPVVLVHGAPGRIRVGWAELDEPTGDPAAFAVSWSRLFERWLLPSDGIVPLAERRSAGPEHRREPRGEVPRIDPRGVRPAQPGVADAWLAGSAAVLALAAVAAGLLRGT